MKARSRGVAVGPVAGLGLMLAAFACGLVPPRRAIAAAAEPPPKAPAGETFVLATSLITPFFGAYYLEGKVRVSDSFAVVANTSYLTLASDGWKNRAGTVGVGAEYFFRGNALRGWYAELIGEVWFSSWRHDQSGTVAPVSLGTAGIALVGYQFVFGPGLAVDLGAGVVGVHLPAAHADGAGARLSSPPFTRVYPAAKINVGWAF